MYFASVILLLLICPLASVAIEAGRLHEGFASVALIGRWWTFWAVGVRLFVAGIRQVVQPRFTAEEIFEIHDLSVLPIVREIGFANLSMGTLGILSVVRGEWVVPAAIVGGLYYGLAGFVHLPRKNKNAKENVAMVSDGLVAGLLAWFVVRSLM
jgi:hypothetical protein